jgi:hypothetical protein
MISQPSRNICCKQSFERGSFFFSKRNHIAEWLHRQSANPLRMTLKFGVNRMVRGVNEFGVVDLGSMLPDVAAANGAR